MWRACMQRYRAWEEEQLGVLDRPARAAAAPPGWRRTSACRIAQLSDIERQQLAHFTRKYQGARIWIPIGALALAFSAAALMLQQALAPAFPWHKALIGANGIGFTCVAMYVGAWFNYRQMSKRLLRVVLLTVGLAICGATLGVGIGALGNAPDLGTALAKLPRVMGIVGLGTVVIMVLPMMLITAYRNRQYATLTAALQRDAEQARLARALSESQLRLLRAQIEPHFLFNTLGAVQQLAEDKAPQAAALTADLIAFLRASLDEMRSDTVTLADEFGLVDAYLRVMQVRLGARLRFALTLPAPLATLRLPSMLLLTLVENAIKHGIEPALRGGEVLVAASVDGDVLRLQVADTGVGLAAGASDGTGLANARRRLELAHHGAASLRLTAQAGGTLAEITLPAAP